MIRVVYQRPPFYGEEEVYSYITSRYPRQLVRFLAALGHIWIRKIYEITEEDFAAELKLSGNSKRYANPFYLQYQGPSNRRSRIRNL